MYIINNNIDMTILKIKIVVVVVVVVVHWRHHGWHKGGCRRSMGRKVLSANMLIVTWCNSTVVKNQRLILIPKDVFMITPRIGRIRPNVTSKVIQMLLDEQQGGSPGYPY